MRGAPERIAKGWSILTWKHWAWAIGLGVLVSAMVQLQMFDNSRHLALERAVRGVPCFALCGCLYLLAIVYTEARRKPPTMWNYLAGVVVASVACLVLVAAITDPSPPEGSKPRVIAGRVMPPVPPEMRRIGAMLRGGFDAVMHGSLFTFIYVRLRQARLAAQALADAEVERADSARRLLESQLELVREQVDPVEVLATLDRIEVAYRDDPVAADALLDELIASLRAALARLRTQPAKVAA